MKKILSNILLVIAAIALILACAETPDGGVSLAWTGSWLVVFALAAKGWEYINPEEE